MDFLERFSERDRERLISTATTVRIGRGELLLRRGERGGDLYRVTDGELEVVDTRSQPVIVLDVHGKGSVVGEMSFLQDTVRSVDVRAPDGAICQRWDRGQLMRMFEQEPALAAGFYRVLATLVVERHKAVVTSAVTGGMGGHGIPRGPTNDVAAADGKTLAEALTARLRELEPVLRRDRVAADRELGGALRNFGAALNEALARMTEEDGQIAGEVVRRELHPYTMRSHLGELALDRDAGAAGFLVLMNHLLGNRAGGDGPLGEVLDAWLLSSPTSRGLRERRALTVQLVLDAVPQEPPMRITLVGVSGGLLPSVVAQLGGRMPGELTCIDGDRATLSAVESAVNARSGGLRVRLVQEDLVRLCLGGSPLRLAPQHVVVVDGLLEYLPERVAASAARWAHGQLAPGGCALFSSLQPAADEALFRYVLAWPTVRRTPGATTRMLQEAGFADVRVYEAGGVGAVAVAR